MSRQEAVGTLEEARISLDEIKELAERGKYGPQVSSLWSYSFDDNHHDPQMLVRIDKYGVDSGWTSLHTTVWHKAGLTKQEQEDVAADFQRRDGLRLAIFQTMICRGHLEPMPSPQND